MMCRLIMTGGAMMIREINNVVGVLCFHCSSVATHRYTKVVEGKTFTFHLCRKCAQAHQRMLVKTA